VNLAIMRVVDWPESNGESSAVWRL